MNFFYFGWITVIFISLCEASSTQDSYWLNKENDLINLNWTEVELKGVAKRISGSKIYLHENATEKTFKSVISRAKILHLATHTIINDDYPMYSRLILRPDEEGEEDGFINTFELYNLKLNTELVVLSACNTGVGKLVNSEGMMSLARGFRYAGCASMIVSLWSIDDKSTSQIMTYFYEHLAKGCDISNALRNAKLDYIKNAAVETAAPFYWAGLTIIGKNKVIKNKNTFDIHIYLLILLCTCIIFFLFLLVSRKIIVKQK